MPPIRRYLRVSRYTVLEVRIHLKNPADEYRWLLHPSEPALSRVIQAVRPMIVPKLREENERVRKGGKKQPVRDVVVRGRYRPTNAAALMGTLTDSQRISRCLYISPIS